MSRWMKIERVPAPALMPKYGPLTGMRVLMTGSIVAAPFAASLLAEYGAEVIHVERPNVGDPYRDQAPVIRRGDRKVSAGWIQEARNKLSLTLEINLKIPESKEIFLSLIKNCDVWVENMVWTEKLGITEQMLLEVNPKLIIAHISGFGRPQFGGVPTECDRPSYDPIGQAEGGYMFVNGFPEPSPPSHAATFINDYMTAMFAVNGILMAYIHSQKTGKGQAVDIAQIEAMSKVLNDTFVQYFMLGKIRERKGNKVAIFQPGNLFKTKDEKYLYIGAYGPAVYGRFVKALELDLNKYSHEAAGGSIEAINSELGLELNEIATEWVAARDAEAAKQYLLSLKVPCGIVRTSAELAASEHYQKRGNFIEYEDETLGETVKGFGFCPKMSETPAQVWRGAPAIGQDTEAILNTLLGYSYNEIEAFREKGVI
ncbi:CaiB/BaiF CoA transferase family protein [Desulfosporosinus meridiei]|uniref:Putative acyl-CoA transferase/carnitine dehydratase n=1 Tax=Desulfosporosinus meridiei (strain ATCC BAA-275 / DSM 13257 / KCTC 12902 / NCIMB 13706 / S10) TaxID=768704 RepID=J7IYA4_DESMD|nr:CoA transferase [Desulfosporosinus meridiei]AFQ43686.1 putative acyl-CoA transferase/carnitine dehydratase [Desulfosporosinus meridiei DSM 13257]